MTKEEFYTAVNKFLPEDLKIKFKDLKQKFDAANPIVAATAPAATTPAATATPGETTLDDGTAIKYDTPTLSVGSKITIVPSDGTGEVPAPAGDYELADGTLITIDATSTVTILTADTNPAPEGTPADEAMKQIKDLVSKFSAVQAENATYKTSLDAYKSELADLKKQFKSFLDVFSVVMEVPTADPIEAPKNSYVSAINAKADRFAKLNTKK